jgi:hypothetical protein
MHIPAHILALRMIDGLVVDSTAKVVVILILIGRDERYLH